MNCPVDFSRRQVLLTAGIGLVAASSPLLAQSLNGTQHSSRSSGGLYLPNSAAGTPWTPESVRQKAYAMPVVSPAYPQPPSWFLERPSLTITYRTDIELARAMVPEPLMVKDPLVSLSFLWMVAPGIGDYYEFAQSIACFLGDEAVSFRPLMVAENVTAIMLGREVWGLPKKYGHPRVGQNNESYVGTLEYDGTLVARASMAYKYQEVDLAQAAAAMRTPRGCSQSHSRCGRQDSAYCRTGEVRIFDGRAQGSLDGGREPRAVRSRGGPDRRAARSRDRVSAPYARQLHAGARQGRAQLSQVTADGGRWTRLGCDSTPGCVTQFTSTQRTRRCLRCMSPPASW
ncbi:hypothetical protein STW0522PSE72_28430 [Pseudomonas monteilii]|nr:hypothetical protein STW0522PSE72_28430 [Pseudomonas monteilii]